MIQQLPTSILGYCVSTAPATAHFAEYVSLAIMLMALSEAGARPTGSSNRVGQRSVETAMKRRIRIVTRSGDLLDYYMIGSLARHWYRHGHHISVGQDLNAPADIAIMHVDATWIKDHDVPDNPSKMPFLNSEARDISKRAVSCNILHRLSNWDGKVIVKTDANYYGLVEQDRLSRWDEQRQILKDLAPGALPNYVILDAIDEVPDAIWDNPMLVVERFTPEMDGDLYSIRMWKFFGTEGYYERIAGPEPILKLSNCAKQQILDEDVPSFIKLRRRELKLDFGKLDFVIANGVPTLLDANKTPTVYYDENSPHQQRLASGLSKCFDRLSSVWL